MAKVKSLSTLQMTAISVVHEYLQLYVVSLYSVGGTQENSTNPNTSCKFMCGNFPATIIVGLWMKKFWVWGIKKKRSLWCGFYDSSPRFYSCFGDILSQQLNRSGIKYLSKMIFPISFTHTRYPFWKNLCVRFLYRRNIL